VDVKLIQGIHETWLKRGYPALSTYDEFHSDVYNKKYRSQR
jgi:hypothetical protein